MNPLVSLIIPVYNVEDYLFSCLKSVRNQTYKNLEILLIDDGSTDSSGKLCDVFAKTDSRAKVFHKKNGGLSSARNFGIKKSKGDFIFFLDADDYLLDDSIEYLCDEARKTNATIVVTPHIEKRGEKERDFNSAKLRTQTLSVEDALKNMLNERGFNLQATGKLYRSNLFKPKTSPEILFPINKLHEDVGTTYKLFLAAHIINPSSTIAFSSEPKYVYNIHSDSITNRTFNIKKLDLISQTDEMCDAIDSTFPKLKDTTNLRRIHARFSILRQLSSQSEKEKELEASIITYIKSHESWILDNPEATKRDKFAFLSLRLGKKIFHFSWRLYKHLLKYPHN
ncbi:glycosyltransferase family 2 protein [Candidatus Saccharibacteria bacterium]|nr:glycosyltransferase family 2 protein [Candidatus Saccharibacteria bacterium]